MSPTQRALYVLCNRCKETKSHDQFHVRRRRGRVELQGLCKVCHRKDMYDWKKKNPVKVMAINKRQFYKNKARRLKRTYGISIDQFLKMLARQRFKCAICSTKNPGKDKRFSVDHCHQTGRIRGLLCNRCNVALGAVGDSIPTLKSAINYLEVVNESYAARVA